MAKTNDQATAGAQSTSEITIREWSQVFEDLYSRVDKDRHPVDVWDAAEAHFSGMGEAIRRMHFADLMKAASHAFCWMCSFVLACNRVERPSVFALDESFSSVVASKYPKKCGHCMANPCSCNPQTMDGAANKAGKYGKILAERKTLKNSYEDYKLSDWLHDFKVIYGHTIHMSTIESIGFHFLEEAGEEVTALRGLKQLEAVNQANIPGIDDEFLARLAKFEDLVALYETYGGMEIKHEDKSVEAIKARLVHAKMDMLIEFADTFSWFCSILIKVSSIASNCGAGCRFSTEPLWDALRNEYLESGQAACPTCHKNPCDCVFYITDLADSAAK